MKLASGPKEGPGHEAIEDYGKADHRRAARAGDGCVFARRLTQTWNQRRRILRVEGDVRLSLGILARLEQ